MRIFFSFFVLQSPANNERSEDDDQRAHFPQQGRQSLCDTHICTDCNFQGTEQGSEGGQGQIAGNMIIPFA